MRASAAFAFADPLLFLMRWKWVTNVRRNIWNG